MVPMVDLELLARTTDQIFSMEELREQLARGRPLRIKYGVDVTAPFLHIGHAVNLWMMRHFQEHGHVVVFLVGDFTTRIGDPTGKSKTRQVPSREEIDRNAEEFIRQVGQVLLTDPAVFEVRRNSEWFDQMSVDEFMGLLSMVTHSRLIQRDMFQRRIEANHEIYMHELLYPILQGYDSYMLKSDLTIVGTDQLFNELMGRLYQEKFAQAPQVVMTSKITPGTDGKEKQSKTLGNYIALLDTPRDKFGKIMSIPDELLVQYLSVYTELPMAEVKAIEAGLADGSGHPMTAKKRLARALVARYHGEAAGEEEQRWFETTFSERKTPDDVPELRVAAGTTLIDLLAGAVPEESKAALRRLLAQGGVRLGEAKLDAERAAEPFQFVEGDTLKVGKRRWFKLTRSP